MRTEVRTPNFIGSVKIKCYLYFPLRSVLELRVLFHRQAQAHL